MISVNAGNGLGREGFVKRSLKPQRFTAIYARFIRGSSRFETNSPFVNWCITEERC